MSRLDVVIFGATGFTGKYAVYEMVRLAKKYGLTWGIAGRSETKLTELMMDTAKKTGENLSEIKVIIADVADLKSIKEMCEQAKVVANCCGPYRLYGEPVVRAAIECKTHYVDVSGEPQFMETMQLEYDKQARDAGVYVVSACGFDSIPNDMGVLFLQQNFGGTVNSVESYISTYVPPELRDEASKHGAVHYGTWASLVHSLAHMDELKPLREKLYPERLPTFKPKLERKSVLHKKENRWCTIFPGADDSIVYRTQRHLYEREQQRPVQFKAYLKLESMFQAVAMIVGFVFLFLMTKTKFTKKLLLDYPKLFTLGFISHEGPTEKLMKATTFKMELFGEGWESGTDVDSTPPNKKVAVKVSGENPGYGTTVVALILSAVTILKEQDKMPETGGVLTTGVAFKNTDLIKSLTEENIKFEIINDK